MNIGKIICGFIGHTNKVNECMGRITCARCKEILVDTMTQTIDPEFEKTLVYLTGMSSKDSEAWYQKKLKQLLAIEKESA